MGLMVVNGKQFPVDLVVFDKDGLMFKSQGFWVELAETRMRMMREEVSAEICAKWAKIFGVSMEDGHAVWIDPKGTFATASPAEEIAVTAGIIIEFTGLNWAEARALAVKIFTAADDRLDLRRALRPQEGFPEIFERLRAAGIPYAVATSDTRDRVHSSLEMFGAQLPPEELIVTPENVKRGKPNPDMLQVCEKVSGIPAARMVMVGDSFVDVQMAYEAGAIGVGIPETDEMREKMGSFATVIVNSLNDLTFVAE